MEYEGQICRAPMERSAFMLPIMVGCAYNRCKFCNLFRHLKYRILPIEQVEAELLRVRKLSGDPRKIFLGDGSAFDLKTDYLLEILDLIRKYFPRCEAVNMDATVTGILRKSDVELRTLYEHGVRHLYLGIESGLDDVLLFMQKDHNLEQAYEAIGRLHAAGPVYDAHIMTGVAGKGQGQENAEALAVFLNRTKPAHVVNFSMFLHHEVPLYADIANGTYTPADEWENLKEEKRLVELLMTDGTGGSLLYDGFHDYIKFRVRGTLPKDRERMLAKLEAEIQRRAHAEPVFSYVCGECPNLEKCDGNGEVWSMT